MSGVQVGPHKFEPLSPWWHRDKCRACYLPSLAHPVTGWVEARPYGDKTYDGRTYVGKRSESGEQT